MFQDGDKITFPDPHEPGTIAQGTFCEVAVNEPIDGRGAAWVRYTDGERDGLAARVPYHQIRRADD